MLKKKDTFKPYTAKDGVALNDGGFQHVVKFSSVSSRSQVLGKGRYVEYEVITKDT